MDRGGDRYDAAKQPEGRLCPHGPRLLLVHRRDGIRAPGTHGRDGTGVTGRENPIAHACQGAAVIPYVLIVVIPCLSLVLSYLALDMEYKSILLALPPNLTA